MGLRSDHFVTPFLALCGVLPNKKSQNCCSYLTTPFKCILLFNNGLLLLVMMKAITTATAVVLQVYSALTTHVGGIAPATESAIDNGPPIFHADFTQPPDDAHWQGDLTSFRVEIAASGGKLRLDADPESESTYLATRESFKPVQWEWYFRQAFAPSNNNRAYFFLDADRPNLDNEANGFALQTGENGTPKYFRLIHFMDGEREIQLLKSDMEIDADTGYRIRVVQSPDKELHLYLASGMDRLPLLQSETVAMKDSGIALKGHFGFRTHYTATRSDQFYFGNVTLSDYLPKPGVFELRATSAVDPEFLNRPFTEIQVTFNVPPAASDLIPDRFRLDDGTTPVYLYCDHPQICTIRFNRTLDSGLHSLHIDSYQTIYGQQSSSAQKSFFLVDEAAPGDIIINEVLYRPDSHGNNRFIELYNRSEKVIDLRGWSVGRSIGNPVSILDVEHEQPVLFMPNSKAVISEPGLVLKGHQSIHLELELFPPLSRFGDKVYLRTRDKVTIDSLSYHPDWGGNRDGVSMERTDPNGASLDPSNWRMHPDHHTAGLRNYHFDDDPGPPEVLFAGFENSNSVNLVFNRFVTRESMGPVWLDGNQLEMVPVNGNGSGSLVDEGADFTFRSNRNIIRKNKSVTVSSVTDVAGREQRSYSIPLAFPPEPGELIINEIMYQPSADRYSSQPDQSEYLEFRNRSAIPLQLNGVHLHDRPDKNGEVRISEPPDLDLAVLSPGAYAVFYADTSQSFESSRIYRAFPLPQNAMENFYRIDRLTLGFSTQGDEVYLSDRKGGVLDSLWYQPNWHNPNIIDTRGIGLERIHSEAATMDRNNWTSGTTAEGGTPGFENSVSVEAQTQEQAGLQLSPNPFSPTGDGFNDHLIIKYHLDHPNYLMHVRVFDRHGRSVRSLADGERAGLSGQLIWDGRTQNGVMNRTGLYIIHFEAIDPTGGTGRIYKDIAVLATPL